MNLKSFRVFCPGGVIGPRQLRTVAEAAHTYGSGVIRIGNRQELLLPGVGTSRVERLMEELSALQLDSSIGSEGHNITSSWPAARIGPHMPWLEDGVFHTCLSRFKVPPALRVNLADPRQLLAPLFTGDVNFIADERPDRWRIALRAENERVQLPVTVAGAEMPLIVQMLAERPRADWRQPAALALELQQALEGRTFELSSAALPPMRSYMEHEGFHSISAERVWLGIYLDDTLWSSDLLGDIAFLATQQSISRIGITPWRSLIVAGISPEGAEAWRALLASHRVHLRHPESALYWQVAGGMAQTWRRRISRDLDVALGVAANLSFAIVTGQEYEEASVLFQYEGLDWRRRPRFAVKIKDALCPRSLSITTVARRVPIGKLAAVVAEFVAIPLAASSAATPAAEPVRPPVTVHQCPDCRTVYDQGYGDGRSAMAGVLFSDLPSDWTCPVCGAPGSAYQPATQPGSAAGFPIAAAAI